MCHSLGKLAEAALHREARLGRLRKASALTPSPETGAQSNIKGEPTMKIGAVMFFTTDSMQPAALGRALEERGFESLWVPEHTHIPSTRTTPYPAGWPFIPPSYTIIA